jgi:hypothetical protein
MHDEYAFWKMGVEDFYHGLYPAFPVELGLDVLYSWDRQMYDAYMDGYEGYF